MSIEYKVLDFEGMSRLFDLTQKVDSQFPKDPLMDETHEPLAKMDKSNLLLPYRDHERESTIAKLYSAHPGMYIETSDPIIHHICQLVVVATDPELNDQFPDLNLDGGTVVGYAGMIFWGGDDLRSPSPYHQHRQIKMEAMGGENDRIFVFQPFRRKGHAQGLIGKAEETLADVDYGNIEFITEPVMRGLLSRLGYMSANGRADGFNERRWGKLLE